MASNLKAKASLLLVAMPGAPTSVLVLNRKAFQVKALEERAATFTDYEAGLSTAAWRVSLLHQKEKLIQLTIFQEGNSGNKRASQAVL